MNKSCIACKYFRMDEAVWYSTLTGGDDASIWCGKGQFPESGVEDMVAIGVSAANKCVHYTLSDLAIASGWTP